MKSIERDRPIFASSERMKQLFDYGRDALLQWEKEGRLIEGVHFIKISGKRRYNVALIEDLLCNWEDSTAHQRAIANYAASLPSNQKPKK